MTNDEYRLAKMKLGIENGEIWGGLLGVSKDTDKSYSCGRVPVSDGVVMAIKEMLESKVLKIERLAKIIKNIFSGDEYSVAVEDSTLDVVVTLAGGTEVVRFVNKGKDWFGQDVVQFPGIKKGDVNILIFYPKTGPVSGKVYGVSDCDWFCWRCQSLAKNRAAGYAQNYRNEINKKMIELALGFEI